MASLSDVLTDATRRHQIVQDSCVVLDQEVGDKGGVAGLVIKGAFGLVKGMKPGIIPELIEGLLPDFTKAIDPILAKRPPGADIASFLTGRTNEIVQALLAVTDQRAAKTPHQTLLKAYQKLRPTAEKHVGAAIPRVAAMVAKHLGAFEKAA